MEVNKTNNVNHNNNITTTNSNHSNSNFNNKMSLYDSESYRDIDDYDEIKQYLDEILAAEQKKKDSASLGPTSVDQAAPFDTSSVVVIGNLPIALSAKMAEKAKEKIAEFLRKAFVALNLDVEISTDNFTIPMSGEVTAQCCMMRLPTIEDADFLLKQDNKLEFNLGGVKKSLLSIKPYSEIVSASREDVEVKDDYVYDIDNSMFFMDNKVDHTKVSETWKHPLGMYNVNIKGKAATTIYKMETKENQLLNFTNPFTSLITWSPSGKFFAFYVQTEDKETKVQKGGIKILGGNNFADIYRIPKMYSDEIEQRVQIQGTYTVNSIQFSPCENFLFLQIIYKGEQNVDFFFYWLYKLDKSIPKSHTIFIKEFKPSDQKGNPFSPFNPLDIGTLGIFSVYTDTEKLSNSTSSMDSGSGKSSRSHRRPGREFPVIFWDNAKIIYTFKAEQSIHQIIEDLYTKHPNFNSPQYGSEVSLDALRLANNKKDIKMDMTFDEFASSVEIRAEDGTVTYNMFLTVKKAKRMEICAKVESISLESSGARNKLKYVVYNGKDRYVADNVHGVSKDFKFLNNGMPKFSFDGRFVAQITKPGFLSIFEVKDGFNSLLHSATHMVDNIVDFEWSPAPFLKKEKGKTDKDAASSEFALSAYHISYWSPGFGGFPGKMCVANLEKGVTSTLTVISSCAINSDCIIKGDIYWQNEGDYVALVVLDYKHTVSSVMFCRICEDKFPTEQLEDIKLIGSDEGGIISFSWEPFSHRFLIQLPNELKDKYDYFLYQMRTPVKEALKGALKADKKNYELVYRNNICLINTIVGSKFGHTRVGFFERKKEWDSVYWSPMGKYLVLTMTSESKQGRLKFLEVDDKLVDVKDSNKMVPIGLKEIKEVEPLSLKREQSLDSTQTMKIGWDATGQILAAVYIEKNAQNRQKDPDVINFFSFQGRLLDGSTVRFPGEVNPIRLFFWRPSIDNADLRKIKQYLSTPGPGAKIYSDYVDIFIEEEDAVERERKRIEFAVKNASLLRFLDVLKSNDASVRSLLDKQKAARAGFDERSENWTVTNGGN